MLERTPRYDTHNTRSVLLLCFPFAQYFIFLTISAVSAWFFFFSKEIPQMLCCLPVFWFFKKNVFFQLVFTKCSLPLFMILPRNYPNHLIHFTIFTSWLVNRHRFAISLDIILVNGCFCHFDSNPIIFYDVYVSMVFYITMNKPLVFLCFKLKQSYHLLSLN